MLPGDVVLLGHAHRAVVVREEHGALAIARREHGAHDAVSLTGVLLRRTDGVVGPGKGRFLSFLESIELAKNPVDHLKRLLRITEGMLGNTASVQHLHDRVGALAPLAVLVGSHGAANVGHGSNLPRHSVRDDQRRAVEPPHLVEGVWVPTEREKSASVTPGQGDGGVTLGAALC